MPAKEVSEESRNAKHPQNARSARRPSAKTKPANGERARVKLTHPDRVYWPEDEVTKQQLADYYTAVWDHMAPHLVDRPARAGALSGR